MGTATYFSPEQAEGAAVDGRSDIFSLGVVLYEMPGGRPPFVGDSPVEVSSQHVHGTVPPPSDFNRSIPARSPSDRHRGAREVARRRYQSSGGPALGPRALQRRSDGARGPARRRVLRFKTPRAP